MSPERRDMSIQFRWSKTNGDLVCPHCGDLDCYALRRRAFKCSGCHREFSVTSGAVFAFHKLGFWEMLAAIWMSVNAVKGIAALHLYRQLGVQYKTAWVLSLKIQEALGLRRVDMKLDGQVQMDGKYAGGHIKPENKAAERFVAA